MNVTREQIVGCLSEALESQPFVIAAWLGGSDATGRTDEWSDVDIQALVEDDRVEETFRTVHEALGALSPIGERFRLPQPTWHGHEQELLSLRDADACHFVDFVIMKRGSDDWFLEPERHGRAQVLFDREGLVKPAPFDRAAHSKKMGERLPRLRSSFLLLQNLVTKAVRRGAKPDAVASYLNFTIRPLVELLRMRHAPDRYDFGLRYLDRDLPKELREEIEALVLPGSLEELEAFRARAEARFVEELRALDEGEWSLS